MAMSEKEVFYALLRNQDPPVNLKGLCEKAGISYDKTYKSLGRSTLHNTSNMEMHQICRALGVSYDDLTGLLTRAVGGEFPDDCPKESITLKHNDWHSFDERTIVAYISKKEEAILKILRSSNPEALDKIIAALEDK